MKWREELKFEVGPSGCRPSDMCPLAVREVIRLWDVVFKNLDRLIAIAEGAERGGTSADQSGGECPICRVYAPTVGPIEHTPACPYSDEWEKP